MGIFDVFTADPAKKAAEENSQRLTDLNGIGTGILNRGQENALGALDSAANAYTPLYRLAGQFGQGTDMYLNSLGLNGQAGNDAATAAFQNNPGYTGAIDAGLSAINRRRAAGGMLNSGNADLDALQFAQNLQNQQYGNWQTNLAGLGQNQLAATGAYSSGVAGANTNRANVYGNTANSLLDLNKFTTNGINSQATQSANAEMAGSGNLWSLGLNLAKLGAGGLGGMGGGGMGLGSGSSAMTTGRLY